MSAPEGIDTVIVTSTSCDGNRVRNEPYAILFPFLEFVNVNQLSANLSFASLPDTPKYICLASTSVLEILNVCFNDLPVETFN